MPIESLASQKGKLGLVWAILSPAVTHLRLVYA
jgi:hypothetical protein